ncbi:MAG: TonB-dependent receptor [Gammaproteobacteria bacterium]|nr:MAG: TonB-dependent receptor [Gammaproteobacteria bacterium]
MKSQQLFNFTKKNLTSLISSITLAALAHTAVAQIGSASVQGVVASHTQPQQGLEVTAKNIDNGYTFRAITQQDGSYTFKGLAPGRYQVLLQNKLEKEPKTITLKVGQSVALDFEIDKSSTNDDKVDEITVIGTNFKLKNTSGEIGTNVSLEQIQVIPQNTRNFLSFADLAPGVQFTQASDGSTKIRGGAQTGNAINVFIDGVGQKNYVLQGGVAGQDSSRGNPFPQSAIGEYKVITQNYSAEYDQLSSAAIVAVTASGTNEFHGGIFYDYSNEGMREMYPAELKDNKKVPGKQNQYGVSIGGPIIKDKMHFFLAYEAKNNVDPKSMTIQATYTPDKLPPQFADAWSGIPAEFQEDLYFVKLDYLINDAQKLELSAKIRDETELTSVGGTNLLSYGTDKKNDETRIDLSHNWREDNWTNDFHVTYEDATYNPRAHTRQNGIILTNNARAAILNAGGGPDYQNKSQKGWGIQEDFTYHAISNHVIKAGFKYKSLTLNATEQQPYNAQYEYDIEYDLNLTQPNRVRWGAPLAGIGDGSAESDNEQYGIYIQDDWTVSDRLNINAGVRWDYEESSSFLDYKTPDDLAAALRGWTNLQNSNINIEDYISDGSNRNSFKNAWQPRFGFTYKLNEEIALELFGGVGRAYDRNIFDYLQTERTKATFPTYEKIFKTGNEKYTSYDSCNLGTPTSSSCLDWDPQYLTPEGLAGFVDGTGTGREVNLVNNNLKTPYSDQFSLGLRGDLSDEWKGEFSFSRIESKDGYTWILGNRQANGEFFEPGKTWGAPWTQTVPGFGNLILSNTGVETKTNSFYLKLDKPKEENGWGMNVAYTYTDATSNRKVGEIYSLDYPRLSDYGVHRVHDLPEHRLVIAGITDLPGGVVLSAKLNLQSVETFYGQDCRAGWDACVYRTFKPDSHGFLGYKQLDISLSKDIETGYIVDDSVMTLRLDILNVTNSKNYDSYQDWYGDAGGPLNPKFGQPNDTLAGPPLTLKVGLNWKW